MSKALRVLIVYNGPADRTLVQALLARSSLDIGEVRYADGLRAAIEVAQGSPYDVILANLPDCPVADSVSTIQAQAPDAAVILLTSVDDDQTAAASIRGGAQDCLVTGRIDPYFLSHAIRCALERKRMERAIRRSEARLRNIIEHSTNLFYSHAPDHTFTYASPQVKQILGYDPDEFCMRWTDIVTDNPVNVKAARLTEEAIRTGQPQPPYEVEAVTKEGQKKWLEIHEAPVVVDGCTVSIVGAAADITARKQAEETLHEVSAFRNTIITNAAEGLCVCHEVPDHPFLVFTVWNDRMTEITGYTKDEINGLGWYQAVFPDPCVQARAVERIARVRQGEDLVSEEWVITRGDGQERTLLISTPWCPTIPRFISWG
jgi:PAS domain S-box-containing protein